MSDALFDAARKLDLEKRAAEAISIGRTRFVIPRRPDGSLDTRLVFWQSLVLRLKPVCCWGIPTMATDGKRLLYNPDFTLRLSDDERLFVLAHETAHCAFSHITRRGDREPEKANVAMDLAVNSLLVDAGFKMPPCGLLPGAGMFANLPKGQSFEWYYANMPADAMRKLGGSPDPGGCGQALDAGDDPAQKAEAEGQWKVAVQQAANAAKKAGALPGQLESLVTELVHPKLDWRAILRHLVSALAKNDYAWTPPGRRGLSQGLTLPSLRSNELGHVVLACDTSGSIWGQPELLKAFAGEMQGILDAYDCRLTILYHDTHVQGTQEWCSTDGPIMLKARGGGGTDHACIFRHIAEHGLEPKVLIGLTDLETSGFGDIVPEYPVIWASTEDHPAPFGDVIVLR